MNAQNTSQEYWELGGGGSVRTSALDLQQRAGEMAEAALRVHSWWYRMWNRELIGPMDIVHELALHEYRDRFAMLCRDAIRIPTWRTLQPEDLRKLIVSVYEEMRAAGLAVAYSSVVHDCRGRMERYADRLEFYKAGGLEESSRTQLESDLEHIRSLAASLNAAEPVRIPALGLSGQLVEHTTPADRTYITTGVMRVAEMQR